MRTALVAAGVLVLLVSTGTTAHAQFVGRLTSRPAAPPVPRTPVSPPPRGVPIWWPWGVVMLPETTRSTSRPLDDAPTGGVQLDVTPWSAEVYVDGALAGRVEQFRGYYHHLELSAGPHTIAIVHAGRDPQVFDVVVLPGRTITYRGTRP